MNSNENEWLVTLKADADEAEARLAIEAIDAVKVTRVIDGMGIIVCEIPEKVAGSVRALPVVENVEPNNERFAYKRCGRE